MNETKAIASDNVKKLAQNNTEIEEEEMIAQEIEQEEIKRSRCLYVWIALIILIVIAVIVVVVLIVAK